MLYRMAIYMKKILFAVISFVLAAASAGGLFLSKTGTTYRYTQIDNTKIEKIESRGGVIDLKGGVDYQYALPSYDEDGEKKEISFGTSRELREGAFIRLTVAALRGVTKWEEVQYDELPLSVQDKYEQKES